MISLQNKLRQMGRAFAALTENCYHYYRPLKKLPALIWAEDTEATSFHSNNGKSCQNIQGTIDLYTKTEFDPIADAVQDTLEDMGLTWSLNSVQYEDETQTIHMEWVWEVATDGENDHQGA